MWPRVLPKGIYLFNDTLKGLFIELSEVFFDRLTVLNCIHDMVFLVLQQSFGLESLYKVIEVMN